MRGYLLAGLAILGMLAGCRTVESVEPEVAAAHFGELRENLLKMSDEPRTEAQYVRYELIGLDLGYERNMRPLKAELNGTPRRIIKQDKTVERYPARVLWEIVEERGLSAEPRVYQEWREEVYFYHIYHEPLPRP